MPKIPLELGITILGMLIGLGGTYAALSAENADTKRRITHLESGEIKTHQLIQSNAREIKSDLTETKQNVNLILQELKAMQAVERERNLERMREDARRRAVTR